MSAHHGGPAFASPSRPLTASSDAHGFENSASRAHEVPAGSSDADVDKYVSEYRILSVRQRVLSNELLDIQAQISQVARKTRLSCLLFFCDILSHRYVQAEMKVQSGAIVRDHMQKELFGAEERMRLLQQEIALIKIQVSNWNIDDSYEADTVTFQICSQDEKVADATRSINDLQQRRSLVESSLQVHKLLNLKILPNFLTQSVLSRWRQRQVEQCCCCKHWLQAFGK